VDSSLKEGPKRVLHRRQLRTGFLEHDDWWNHIAVDGMDPEQVQYLREEDDNISTFNYCVQRLDSVIGGMVRLLPKKGRQATERHSDPFLDVLLLCCVALLTFRSWMILENLNRSSRLYEYDKIDASFGAARTGKGKALGLHICAEEESSRLPKL